MPICAVGAFKGGVSKTMTTVNLAVARAMRGHSVLIVDADGHQHATKWHTIRYENNRNTPGIDVAQYRGKLGYTVKRLAEKFDTVLIDCDGIENSVELLDALDVADRVLVPTAPGQFDVWSLSVLRDEIVRKQEQLGRPIVAGALLSIMSTSSKEAEQLREDLAHLDDALPVLYTEVRSRKVYRDAAKLGQGVLELKGALRNADAVAEVESLYVQVFDHPDFRWRPQ